jgi:hypothetical protein
MCVGYCELFGWESRERTARKPRTAQEIRKMDERRKCRNVNNEEGTKNED